MFTLENTIYLWTAIGIIIFPILLRITAPYGRHTTRNWGPMISNNLGWIIMEFPSLLLMPLLFFLSPGEKTWLSWIFPLLWIIHYANRTFIFPLRIRTKGKQMPLLIAIMAIGFNLMNGSINGLYLGNHAQNYTAEWLTDIRFMIGLLLFIGGMAINWQSDTILINLRKPGEKGYKIPYGGMFRWISCPNHFGEIIEWTGFAILTWSISGLAFAIWTAVNLIPRALDHHRWYRETFEDYPADRKAVIPFLW